MAKRRKKLLTQNNLMIGLIILALVLVSSQGLPFAIAGTEFGETPQTEFSVGIGYQGIPANSNQFNVSSTVNIDSRSLQANDNTINVLMDGSTTAIGDTRTIFKTIYPNSYGYFASGGSDPLFFSTLNVFIDGEDKGQIYDIQMSPQFLMQRYGSPSTSTFGAGGNFPVDNEGYSDLEIKAVHYVRPANSGTNEYVGQSTIMLTEIYKEPELCNVPNGYVVFTGFAPAGTVLSKDGFTIPVQTFCHDEVMYLAKIDVDSDITLSAGYEEYDIMENGSTVTVPTGQVWRYQYIAFAGDIEGIVCEEEYEYDPLLETCVPSFVTLCDEGQFNPELGICINGSWQPCQSGVYNLVTGECMDITGECVEEDGYDLEVEVIDGYTVCTYIPYDVPPMTPEPIICTSGIFSTITQECIEADELNCDSGIYNTFTETCIETTSECEEIEGFTLGVEEINGLTVCRYIEIQSEGQVPSTEWQYVPQGQPAESSSNLLIIGGVIVAVILFYFLVVRKK